MQPCGSCRRIGRRLFLAVTLTVIFGAAGADAGIGEGGRLSHLPVQGSDSRVIGAGQWTGTVTVVEDVDYTATPTPDVTHVVYHDRAVYTLRGEVSTAGLELADMTGSGTGRSTVTHADGCVRAADPYYQWSYAGPASVSVARADGRWVITPQSVPTTYGGTAEAACGAPADSHTFSRPAPSGLQDPPAGFQPHGQSAAADALTLSGSEKLSFAPPFALSTLRIGTATLSWNLRRASAGGGNPNPKRAAVRASKPFIHRAGGRTWVYGRGEVESSCPSKKISVTLYQLAGGKYRKVGGPSTKTGAGNRCVLSAIASLRCAEPYTDSKFKVVAIGWTFVAGSWNYEATKTSTKRLNC